MIGQTVGPYKVVAKLGEGGMGEVYRARDTALNRDVALKVLPESVATDPDRLARFQREAESLAALNHPNIAQIYGLEQRGDSPAIIMELVEGSTLADLITAGPLPLDEALSIARQIADALEAAHERGIIHRDLKPANVKVTGDGVVKVLDFGLAKAIEPPGEPSGELANSPTLTARATQLGVVLGTAAYMAPEQARGKPVDKRADLWAFGCVLFEMLTGRRTFAGEDVTDTLASVLKSEPNLNTLPADTPPAIRKLLQRCLEKDRKRRLADAADARLEIEEALAAGSAPAPAPARPPRAHSTVVVAGLALLAGALLAWGAQAWLQAPAPSRLSRFVATSSEWEPVGLAGNSQDVAISPDGGRIVYTSVGGQLAVRDLDSLVSRPLEGLGTVAYGPFFSPDGDWVAYNDQSDRTLKRVSVLGGPPTVICAVGSEGVRGASWGDDGSIVFGTLATGGLWRVPADGGTPIEVSTPEAGTNHVWPEVLPGGRRVLFTILTPGSVETSAIALLDLDSRAHTVLISGGAYPRYVPTGHIVYGVDGALHAVGFDAAGGQVTTSSVPVQNDVVTKTSGAANFAIARDGTFVYVPGTSALAARTLVWVDRDGGEEPIDAPARAYFYPRLSPDGTRLALDVREGQNDIWVWDLTRRTLTRLTFDLGLDRMPVWSPDGARIAYSSTREGAASLFWQPADGTGTAERLTDGGNDQYPAGFTPDGRQLVFSEQRPTADLMVVSVGNGAVAATPLIESPAAEWNGVVSPDGRWLAYQSNESGRPEIYVRPFPDVEAGRWQISTEGGTRPAWRSNGQELFYFNAGQMVAVPIDATATFAPGVPQVLFEGAYAAPQIGRVFDVTPDGQRFVMLKNVADPDVPRALQVVVVLNWFDELTRLVPVR